MQTGVSPARHSSQVLRGHVWVRHTPAVETGLWTGLLREGASCFTRCGHGTKIVRACCKPLKHQEGRLDEAAPGGSDDLWNQEVTHVPGFRV